MTENGIASYLGKTGSIQVGDFTIDVEVRDAKQAYGRTLVLVKPEPGGNVSGEAWITAEKVKFN